MNFRTFSKYAVGILLAYSTASTAYYNIKSRSVKEKVKPVRVDYGLVGDTLRYNPNGNAILNVPDSIRAGLGDFFIRTGKDQFEHNAFNIKSIKSSIDSLGIHHDTIYFADKPTITTIKAKLNPIKAIILKAK